ncbi:FAD-binding oxidoreductase [Paraburkholderia phymatum]|uniref:FAD-binding oxidoreductase n=1 Tax=Paraburkholderia phymatum TaxID=148447 RepID=A0ACC6U6P8_9BURK
MESRNQADILATLIKELGTDIVTPGIDVAPRYFTGYGEASGSRPLALARPRSVDEVSRIMRLCHRIGVSVVPQGGITGLAGGAVPLGGEIVLSMERCSGIEEIDAAASTVTIKAGTVLQTVQDAVRATGFELGYDLGARGSCQIGGNLATNAGGNRAIRFGVVRDQVLGLEAVLADGTIVSSLNKMLKNNTGYDWKHLLIGSEGTLGVITRAVLKLYPELPSASTCLCVVPDYQSVVALWQQVRAQLPDASSFEVMWPDFYRYVSANTPGVQAPLPAQQAFYVLIECATAVHDAKTSAARLENCLGAWLEAGLVSDAVLATSLQQAQVLWLIREGLAIDELPNLINYDVSLPIGLIGEFAERCEKALISRWPQVVSLYFGHLGDSNVHIGVSLAELPAEGVHAVDVVVYDVVRAMGGSVSAEHGIGTHKKPFLGYSRSPAELALMRTLKAALDPKGILNPGKVL